jgi:Gas vesicle protein K
MTPSFSSQPQSNSQLEQLELKGLLRQAEKLELDPEKVENGLAKLVLTIIELLRQLCEKQALQRMDNGNLTDEEIERLGNAFMRLNNKMDDLKKQFELTDEDLNLDLGPLGRLM